MDVCHDVRTRTGYTRTVPRVRLTFGKFAFGDRTIPIYARTARVQLTSPQEKFTQGRHKGVQGGGINIKICAPIPQPHTLKPDFKLSDLPKAQGGTIYERLPGALPESE